MNRLLLISIAAISAIADTHLSEITVQSDTLCDVSGEQIRSADVAEALAYELPSVNLVRRSGIANDVIVRGQKRDNINILIDGAKVYGACPNRMDPPTSHIVTHHIDAIDVIEGPYDVENFGTLSGMVKVKTIAPEQGIRGKMGLNAGSYGYRKLHGSLGGGDETARFLVNGSTESADPYEDGNGHTFSEQIDQAIAAGQAKKGNAYQNRFNDLKAFQKNSIMGKLYLNPMQNHELQLSYTYNRSQNVLYPNTPMDALYNNSDLYNAQYTIKALGEWSKTLQFKYYHAFVDHPMSTQYRLASSASFPANGGKPKEITNHLTATIDGIRIKNSIELDKDMILHLGVDGSTRKWDGHYRVNGQFKGYSIDHATTQNGALFAEYMHRFDLAEIHAGLRLDTTEIKSDGINGANTYDALNGFLHLSYQATPTMKLFGGVGSSSRVPDGRELYFQKSGTMIGTPNLRQTFNRQGDLGVEHDYDTFRVKLKGYYSLLEDYIYFHSGRPSNKFVNIDASIYGAELSGTMVMNEAMQLDFGTAYVHGEKSKPLEGQTNKNLADIPPLKGNVTLKFAYMGESVAVAEWVGATKWDKIDDDNGEQIIGGWSILKLKIDHRFDEGYAVVFGVDNVFDAAYAVSNTYKDLTLLSVNPNDNVMRMNEPGRYMYVNLSYTF